MNRHNAIKDEFLHRKLRGILCRKIFEGDYADGALLPAERDLALKYRMSRVTVRSTLASMQAEGLVVRMQGHGTRVRLQMRGHSGEMDIIAVIAPADNPFFASFLSHFEDFAERHGALVVFAAARKRTIADTLFRLYQRNIRNAVVWPYDEVIDIAAFDRIRGLAMNIVMFDRSVASGAVDCVSVDNEDAVAALCKHLQKKCDRNIAYIGWDNDVITSNCEREAAFKVGFGSTAVYRLPWRKERDVDCDVAEVLKALPAGVEGIVCGNGVIGIAAKKCIDELQLPMAVACVDDLPGAESLMLTAYAQPMEKLACLAHHRLAVQNDSAGEWKARNVRVKGSLIVRS